jgi:hypothetical protein
MIRFSSPNSGDVPMLAAHARMLIEAMGKRADERGVITAKEVPAALALLRAAIDRESANAPPQPDDGDDPEERERRAQYVSLRHRAFPLMQMLERAAKAGKDVTWGI